MQCHEATWYDITTIDLANQNKHAEHCVTLGCNEECPFPNRERISDGLPFYCRGDFARGLKL